MKENQGVIVRLENKIKDLIANGTIAASFGSVTIAALLNSNYDVFIFSLFATIGFFVKYKFEQKEYEQYSFKKEQDISRENDEKKIIDAIRSKDIVIVSGSSGVGKSILLETIKNKLIVDTSFDYTIKPYSSYGEQPSSKKQAAEELTDTIKSSPNKILFIFDQLENIFLLDDKDLIAAICKVIENCSIKKGGWKCILIIRKEWLLNLRLFPKLNHTFEDIQVISGINIEDDSEVSEGNRFRKELLKIIDLSNDNRNHTFIKNFFNKCMVSKKFEDYESSDCKNFGGNKILPIEAISLAKGLRYIFDNSYVGEKETFISSDNTMHELGDRRSIMQTFFDAHLDAYLAYQKSISRAKRIFISDHSAKQVLFALCVKPGSKRSLSIDELCYLTDLRVNEVKNVLAYFAHNDIKLLSSLDDSHYDWAHDFYAEQFNEYSTANMDSKGRDNITYFWDQLRAGRKSPPPKNPSGDNWGLVLFILSFMLLWGRVLSPVFERILRAFLNLQNMFQPLYQVHLTQTPIIDISFIPIAVSLTGWSWYVSSFYRRILSQLDEKRWYRLYSYILPFLLCFILVLWSVLCPKLWIVFVSIGGLFVGIKYVQIAYYLKMGYMNREVWFGRVGISSCVVSCLAIVAGCFYIFMFPPDSFLLNPSPVTLALVSFIIMFCMIFWIIVASTEHTHKNLAPIRIGTYKRYSSLRRGETK
jgi:hypothetical protein